MRVTDTNSKGKVIIQSRSGAYMALEEEELQEAIDLLIKVKLYREEGLPRDQIDSRKY